MLRSELAKVGSDYGRREDYQVEAERLAAWKEMNVGACEIGMFPEAIFT